MHRDHFRIGSVFGSVLMLLMASSAFSAGEFELAVFEDGAQRRGTDYVRSRDVLAKQSSKLLPMLKEKAKSQDWQQRVFAQILINRIQHRDDVTRWNKALSELLKDRSKLATLKTYTEPEWDKLPTETNAIPASHLVDVLWETIPHSSSDQQIAVAVQFYLKPQAEAAQAVIEVLTIDARLKFLAQRGLVKLGPIAVPHLHRVLEQTVPPVAKDRYQLTVEERNLEREFWRQTNRAQVAARVLAELQDVESIPLIVKCLKQRTTRYEYVEGLCAALARLKASSEIDTILDHLLRSATARNRRGNNDRPGYDALRGHILNFGPDAIPAVSLRLKSAKTRSDRVVLDHLVVDLSEIDGKRKEVAALRESLWFDATASKLLHLHELTSEDVFPRLAVLVREQNRSSRTNQQQLAMQTLGKMQEPRAVPLLTDVLNQQHKQLQRILTAKTRVTNEMSFDAQLIREASGSFGREESNLAKVLDIGDGALQALRQIGSAAARQAVVNAVEMDEYKTRAQTSLLLIDKRVDELVARLDSNKRDIREEAALALLDMGDVRSTRELICAAARRQGLSHEQWKQRAIASKKDLKPELKKLLDSKNVRERVLAKSMLLAAQSPEKADRWNKLLQVAAQGVAGMHVIQFSMIEASGRALAGETDSKEKAEPPANPARLDRPNGSRQSIRFGRFEQQTQPVDLSFLALVEASCLFDQGVIRRGIAAFALAEWKQKRSMQVLAESFNMGSLAGSNPAALALSDFGAEGAKLAASVPPPQPGQHDTGLRMTQQPASWPNNRM
jgi:hypothetical protein